MKSISLIGAGLAVAVAAGANAAVTGLQVEYGGLVGGRHVWSVYAVSNDVNHVMLNVIGHTTTAGSMAGVEHNDFGGGTWSPTLTILPDQLANDSYVTVTGQAGAAAGTNLDPSFGAGTGALLAKLIDTGVPDAKVNELREKVTPGTTALALLISHVQPAALNDELKRFAGATVIETNLPDEAVEALRAHAAA